ncbi:major facilitator superfamily domain-containing protein [Xylariaceae sp. FL0804]|nr:major facilitator superfamily domain-containing protein [Xylariaceae sp. FL0804]
MAHARPESDGKATGGETTLVKDASSGDGVINEELSDARARRILIKTDLVVMPLIVVSMTLAFLDKNALSYATLFGLRTDTGLVGQQYSWLGSIFYFGYLAMELPNLWLMTVVPIGKYVGGCLLVWGVILCCTAACHDFAGLAAVRFMLGVFEAALLPCMLIVNAMWYRRDEQPLRTAFWYNTFAGIFGGILSYAIGHINGSLATWKYLFIIYGSVTIFMGFLVFFGLPDSPSKAWFFNESERKLAVVRLAANQTGVETHKRFNIGQIIEALRDLKCYLIWLNVLGYAIVNAGITNFNPLIISGYGFSTTKTTLMATPQAAVAMVAGAVMTAVSYFLPNLRCIFWIFGAVMGLVGAVMVHVLDVSLNRDASLAGVYIMGFYNVPWVFMLSLQSSNTGGATKKSFMGISVAVVYAVGNIIGPQLFLDSQSPTYELGIGAMMCAFAVMAAAGVLYYVVCIVENKRRDKKYGPPRHTVEAGVAAENEDMTDMENKEFRYSF